MAARFIGVGGFAAVEAAASLLDLGLTAWEVTHHDDDAPDRRTLIVSANAVLLTIHTYYLARAVAARQRSAKRIAWWLAVVVTDAAVLALVAGGITAASRGAQTAVTAVRILKGLRYARMGASAINAAIVLHGVRQVLALTMDGVRERLEALAPEETPGAPSCPADKLRPLGAQSKVGELFQCAARGGRRRGDSYIVKRQAISRRRFVRMHRHLPIPDVAVDEFDNEVLAMDVLQALELSERHRLVPRLLWSHTRRQGRGPVGTIAMEQAGLGDLTAYCDKAVVDEATAGDFAAWLHDEARRLYDQSSSVLFTHGDPKAANFFVVAGGGAPQLVFGDVGKARYLAAPQLLVHARPKHGVYVPSTGAVEYTYTAAPPTIISPLAKSSGGPELFWAHERQRPRDRASYQQAAAVERAVLAVSTMLSAGDTAFAAMAQPRVLRVLLGPHLGSSAQVESALERITRQRRRVKGRKSVNAAVRVLAGHRIVAQ